MIDTVEFKIHDLRLHVDLVKFLNGELSRTGQRVTMTTEQAGAVSAEQKLTNRKYLHLLNVGTTVEVSHFDKLASSHYEIAYRIDYLADFIALNVSIPKYAYGTNVLHYNTPPTARDFNFTAHSTLETNLEESYVRLVRFLRKFFAREFGHCRVVESFVQLTRVDLCYNQVFDCGDDALEYLKQMMKVRKKYRREGSNESRHYGTTYHYKTDRYSFKCYHKGTEFKKHDARRLQQLNETKGYDFNVPALQAFANRILRYEMTFRNAYMSYIFMHRLFRKDCHVWQYMLPLWKKNKQYKATPEPGPNSDRPSYWQWKKSLTRDELRAIEYVEGFINRTKQFYLSAEGFNLDFDRETDEHQLATSSEPQRFYAPAKFSRRLLRLMSAKFRSILSEFELQLKEDSATILGKVRAHNQRLDSQRAELLAMGIPQSDPLHKQAGKKISVQKMEVVARMLDTQSFEQIAASGVFSRQTWYNYRRELARVGTTEKSLTGVAIRTKMDLEQYNAFLFHNSRKLGILLL